MAAEHKELKEQSQSTVTEFVNPSNLLREIRYRQQKKHTKS